MDRLAMTGAISELQLANFHQRQQAYDKQQRWLFGAQLDGRWCAPGRATAWALDPRRAMANAFEAEARRRLDALGLFTARTAHSARYDLMAEGVRVEVKASAWNGTAYQANLHGNRADVLAWACLDGGAHWWFVIPFGELRGRRKIEIACRDPRDTRGQWMRWYGAWEIVTDLRAAGRNAWQPALIG